MTTTPPRALGRALACLTFALAPVALAIVWLSTRDEIGTTVAEHWNLGGDPDGYSSATGLAVGTIVACAVLAVMGIAALLGWKASMKALMAPLAGVVWVLAAACGDTLLVARGNADPHTVHSDWWHTLAVLAVAVAAGALVFWLTPSPAQRYDGVMAPAPAYRLAAGERAVWLGSARSRAIWWTGVVLVFAGLIPLALRTFWGLPIVIVGLAALWCHRVDVRVDEHGVVAHLGGVGWPRFRTPIEQVVAAEAKQIEPWQWGGWGYRFTRRGSAIVIRRGPGLVIARTNNADLAITVDAPKQGAELINAFVAARATSAG